MRALAWVVAAASLTAAPEKADQPEKFDLGESKASLRVLTDGKKHYYVYDVKGGISGPAFYGDGKALYQQRIASGGATGDTELSHGLWDPRVDRGLGQGPASMNFKNGKYSISCPPKDVAFTEVPEAEAKALVEAAVFYKPRWNRIPYKLARDERGTYYFVDHQRDAKRDFRLYVGPRGGLKLQQMTNIVSDSVGDIFATKTGELRLILNDNKRRIDDPNPRENRVLKWVSGKSELVLTEVPVDENVLLIYNELGPYEGARLGTPCDDL